MFSGWRGRIGRVVPEPLMSKALERLTKDTGSRRPFTAVSLRESAEQRSILLARQLNIDFTRASNSHPLCVEAANWPTLFQAFSDAGLVVRSMHLQHSYAASSAWSVSIRDTQAEGIADLRGAGAIWQVYPGRIDKPIDAQDFEGNIDAVYTWVDANDPQWANSYQRALAASGHDTSDSRVNLARFKSRDELRYSLRSLELNLPWINKIYLVTAGQRPAWLKEDHPKLVLIDHREIFTDPDSMLPTFNSHAIESQLVHIPDLSEHFIYVNDDVFFGRYLHPNVFFGPAGQAKYCMTVAHFAQAEDPELPINQAAANNRQVVVERFGRTTSRKFQHVAHPQRLEVHRQLHREIPNRIAQIAGHRFRSADDLSIPSSLAHQYAARLGLGFPSSVSYSYIDIGSRTAPLDFLRLARNRNVDMFCINEVLAHKNGPDRSAIVHDFLTARFPLPSSFEKD